MCSRLSPWSHSFWRRNLSLLDLCETQIWKRKSKTRLQRDFAFFISHDRLNERQGHWEERRCNYGTILNYGSESQRICNYWRLEKCSEIKCGAEDGVQRKSVAWFILWNWLKSGWKSESEGFPATLALLELSYYNNYMCGVYSLFLWSCVCLFYVTCAP